jgi:hypothetical protein
MPVGNEEAPGFRLRARSESERPDLELGAWSLEPGANSRSSFEAANHTWP